MDDERTQAARDARIHEDLRALARTTERSLPSIEATARAIERAKGADRMGQIAEGRSRSARRWWAAACGAAVVAALLVVPIPYERVVGYDVKLALAGAPPGPEVVRRVAGDARRALGAERLRVEATEAGVTIEARVPGRSRAQVEQAARVFAKRLGARGVTATASVTAVREHAQRTVYAMAMERVIQIRVDMQGKTDAEVEEEIRAQLAEGGLANPEVSVQRAGGEAQIEIRGGDEGKQVRIVRHTVGGPEQVEMDVGGIDDRREPGMTDEQLRAKIEAQLQARGLSGTVTVHGDHVEVRVEKRVEGP